MARISRQVRSDVDSLKQATGLPSPSGRFFRVVHRNGLVAGEATYDAWGTGISGAHAQLFAEFL